jgi:beta-barrel assembly-enhancing protease
MKRTTGAVLAITLAALPGCGGNFNIQNVDLGSVVKNVGDLREVKEPEELRIGRGVTETLLGARPLLDDAELQRYVNAVGRWVASQSERPDLPWHFGVNDSDHINAFAAPGGYIVVTKGMLRQLRNESELAGVLGHEIAHVVQKHHLNALRKNAALNLLSTGVGAATADSKHAELVRQLAGPAKELYARGLDKADEFEADRMGIVLSARAGYDAYGLPGVLQTLSAVDEKDQFLALLFKTHPPPQTRLDKLAQGMGERFDTLATVQENGRFEQATRRLRVAAQ